MRVVSLALLLSGALAAQAPQERPLPDPAVFAAQVKKHLSTDEERQSGYTFLERRTQERLDSSGRATTDSVKVFEVYPGLPGQDRYRRLIEEDGKRVPAETLAKQDAGRRKDVEAYARAQATSSEREKSAREQEKDRRRYTAAVDDIFRVYEVRIVRREPLEGRDTIFATLTPKPDAKPLTDDGKIMKHFSAKAWISESDYELARVEIEAIDNLSIGMGLLARVHKGTTATYQRRKVNDEVWLPEQVTWTASARVLLVKSLRMRGTSDFSNYRKFTVDTSTTFGHPAAP
jgi:hypothetical protein